ncbi:MAG: LysM peptidoglycan-binding domain-containing M23 family metallopeptidase [Spirochaetes bacterium]|nr:LysM peptidoglycan-binding domain-containing M23 family metallopeptidase [Spirochaetota bacterium]
MQLKKIFKNPLYPAILKNVKLIYRNNSLLSFLILFFIVIMFLNNILISTIKFPGKTDYSYIVFPDIEAREAKYEFQEDLYHKLKKLDFNFYIYTVEKGENYWGIAKTNQVNIDTIIGINPYLKNLYAAIDEKLIVCNRQGAIHIIQKGENITSVARTYDLSIKIIEKANKRNIFKKLFAPLREGDVLFIPDARPKFLTADMKEMYEMRDALQSPLGGRYTSAFGNRFHPILKKRKFHYGLDIKVYVGQPVGASNDGVVVSAGWVSGYGKYVKIKHYNGYMTSYGHLSKIYVKTGQKVSQGQIIGKGGNTGRSTGPHLDFRVWYKDKPMNPALFLW